MKFVSQDLNSLYIFFAILNDLLGFTKAVFLLNNERVPQLKPWCSIGFDETTISKMRIGKNDLNLPKESFLSGAPENLNCSKYLSSKDLGTIENLFILPIFSGNKLIGILLIADNPYCNLNSVECDMIFRPIQDIFRNIIESHVVLCSVPAGLEPKNISDFAQHTEIRKSMVVTKNNGVILDFSFKDSIVFLKKEYPYLLAEAAYYDVRMRFLNNLKLFGNICYVATGHCYLWVKPEFTNDIESIIYLVANELSKSMISSDEYTENLIKSMNVMSLENFIELNQGLVAIS